MTVTRSNTHTQTYTLVRRQSQNRFRTHTHISICFLKHARTHMPKRRHTSTHGYTRHSLPPGAVHRPGTLPFRRDRSATGGDDATGTLKVVVCGRTRPTAYLCSAQLPGETCYSCLILLRPPPPPHLPTCIFHRHTNPLMLTLHGSEPISTTLPAHRGRGGGGVEREREISGSGVCASMWGGGDFEMLDLSHFESIFRHKSHLEVKRYFKVRRES
jgi:hypothetical protein